MTEQLLPPDRPLFAATVRALPVGLVLLALRASAPHGVWWWRALVLGALQHRAVLPADLPRRLPAPRRPGGDRPGGLTPGRDGDGPARSSANDPARSRIGAALVGLVGVGLLVLRSPGEVTALGLAAALGSVLVSAFGFVLIKRWPPRSTCSPWSRGSSSPAGSLLLPIGCSSRAPPAIDPRPRRLRLARGGRHRPRLLLLVHAACAMPAGAVSLVGLLNPVVGTALGVVVAARDVRLGPGARHGAGARAACCSVSASAPAAADAPPTRPPAPPPGTNPGITTVAVRPRQAPPQEVEPAAAKMGR